MGQVRGIKTSQDLVVQLGPKWWAGVEELGFSRVLSLSYLFVGWEGWDSMCHALIMFSES